MIEYTVLSLHGTQRCSVLLVTRLGTFGEYSFESFETLDLTWTWVKSLVT